MKKITLASLFSFLLLICSTPSCNWIDTDINIDPNNPSISTPDLLVPTAAASIAYVLGGDYGRHANIWIQQINGLTRQHAGISQYNVNEGMGENAWNTLYAVALSSLDDAIKQSADGSPHYSGVSKALMAYGLAITTDAFGDVPYSQAFLGAGNLTPAYDRQEGIYGAINILLNEADAELGQANSNIAPGTEDFFYGGDLESWKKFTNTLKARMALRTKDYAGILALIDAGATFTSSADDAEFPFPGGAQANPWSQFLVQRQGDISMGTFFVELLKGKSDPRLPVFVQIATRDGEDGYWGHTPGNQSHQEGNTSLPTDIITGASAPITFLSYTELKFIEAEAAIQTGDQGRANTAYAAAIEASLNKYGAADSTYFATETASPATLESIMTQKYIALFTQFESYTDWRRTGFPALTPAITDGQVPVRFRYPQNERLYNGGNCPCDATIYNPLWWDN